MSTTPEVTSTGGRTETEVRELIREIICELAPEPRESAERDDRLVEDLEYHSLALLEMAFTLEDEFDLAPIDEETARGITTVGLVEDHVVRELRGRDEITA